MSRLAVKATGSGSFAGALTGRWGHAFRSAPVDICDKKKGAVA